MALNVCLKTLPFLVTGIEEKDARPFARTFTDIIADAYNRAELLAHAYCEVAGAGEIG